MSYNPNKLTFKVDELTGEIVQPHVFLCDRQLHILGEIYPVSNLRIKANLNGADEISFRISKKNEIFNQIKEYSVVLARGFGYFEVSPTVSDAAETTKEVQGSSLGEAELSQLLCTLECNTDEDMENFLKLNPGKDYTASVLYDDSDRKHSLIHRILADSAPNYETGHVDETIQNLQRTFSFSKTDVMSCFSQIAEEIGCIFDVVIRKDDDGTVRREVSIYDARYCGHCKGRNIVNGVCQNCHHTDIRGIGEDTTIQISTDNLSDEITLSSDGNMKNCFLVEGGDELMTDAVKGINPSGSGKIYRFSDEMIEHSFSEQLKKKYKKYMGKYNGSKENYLKIYETQCCISDLILYLQSARMPSDSTTNKTLHEEVKDILIRYQDYFPNGLGLFKKTSTSSDTGTSSKNDTSSKNGVVRQILSALTDSGYAVRVTGNYNSKDKTWTGTIVIYQSHDRDTNATITVEKTSSSIQFSDTGTALSDELSALVQKFHIAFSEENYEEYVRQEIALATENYEYLKKSDSNSPKNWGAYSLNRLNSYYSGYENCILALTELKEGDKTSASQSISDCIENYCNAYSKEMERISEHRKKLTDLIYYLIWYHSGHFDSTASDVPSSSDVDYSSPEYKPTSFSSCEEAFQKMVNYIRSGTWTDQSQTEAGSTDSTCTDAPLYCSVCGSTSVTLDGCNICHGTVVTYSGIAEKVLKHFLGASVNHAEPENLQSQRNAINQSLNPRAEENLGPACYIELCSYIREDVYTNNSFISDGLETNNTKLVSRANELLQKAQLELEKACVPQHTVSGNIYAFAAFSSLNPDDFPIRDAYDKFRLGNYMRYISDDGTVYKLRLSSEEFSWEESDISLNVEFTDVIHYANGTFDDIESLVQHVGNLATSFDSVKKQAEQGKEASREFQNIKNEGLYSALGNVLNAGNQDVQITDSGITLRKYDYELDDYSPCQMKLANRNLVMTDDNWRTAKMAIGMGQYHGEPRYGVWADMIVGNMIVGEKALITNKDNTVLIDGNGIQVGEHGSDKTGICIDINPNAQDDKIFNIYKNVNGTPKNILFVDANGDSRFEGEVNATGLFGGEIHADSGYIGNWNIFNMNDITQSPQGWSLSPLGLVYKFCDGSYGITNQLGESGLSGDDTRPYTSGINKRKINWEISSNHLQFRKYADSTNSAYSEFVVGDGTTVNHDPVSMMLTYANGDNFTVNSDMVTIAGLNTKIKADSIQLKPSNNTPFNEGLIEIGSDKVHIHGRVTYEDGNYISEIEVNDKNTSISGKTIYIGDGINNPQQKVTISGNTYIASEPEAPNCYIGGNSYNYGIVETYSGKIFDIDRIDDSATIVYLQKVGRIVILSAVIVLNKAYFTTTEISNKKIGTLPKEYRHSDKTIISCDNYNASGECHIDEHGVICFSCNNTSADYRLHGVWFLDNDTTNE